jgi:hypothetical protein
MDPATYNFSIYQGATWSRDVTYKTDAGVVVDLSSHTARMPFFLSHDSEPFLELTSAAGGGIVLAGTGPNLVVTLTDEQTAAVEYTSMMYYLDIISASGVVSRLLEGKVEVHRGSRGARE